MASNNVETAFRLPSGVSENFIRNLSWQHQQQQQLQKISTKNNSKISPSWYQRVFWKIHWKRSVLESPFNKISGLRPAALSKKRLRHRCFSVNFAKLLGTRFFIEHLRTTHLGRAQNFTINSSKSNC